jgi:hypothetical protein
MAIALRDADQGVRRPFLDEADAGSHARAHVHPGILLELGREGRERRYRLRPGAFHDAAAEHLLDAAGVGNLGVEANRETRASGTVGH